MASSPAPRPRAVIYLRISFDPTGQAAGVRRQLDDCLLLAAALGLDVDLRPYTEGGGIYTDNDISATTGAWRPAFEQLLLDRPPIIITWHADRLVRVGKDLERVIEMGGLVHAKTSSQLDLATPAGRAMARTIIAWATYEGEQKSLRQKLAHNQRAAEGRPMWTIRPFGFLRDGTVVEAEALALRLAYADLLAGKSLSALARQFNADGWRTTMVGCETKRGVVPGLWRQASIRQLLVAPRNAGINVHLGQEVARGTWDPIVPEEVFRAAVKLLTNPARRPGGTQAGRTPENLLTSIAVCGKCDGPITAGVPGYVCRDRRCVSHPKAETDDYVAKRIIAELSRPGGVAWWIQEEAGEERGIEQIREEKVRIEQLLAELGADRGAELITRAQFLEGTEVAKARLADAVARLADAGRAKVLAGLAEASDIGIWWEALSLARQRAVVSLLAGGQLVLLPRGQGVKGFNPTKVQLDWRRRQPAA